ncbi:MAG: aminotransferase class V-fold PLP-dependent enzyme [Armatimonadota bacterium]|nr:aminotransferase class V-fold PLP-dependent enzyme [Armatimonadota bacterium]MDR7534402.1 aminotransferase class V-fold PLP-dependent enzyme [Armatimonadota bacterium]MDR7536288.1 aminotransferase class V-fold PLP-dependent enzyme [Armatimonadota bacterium]
MTTVPEAASHVEDCAAAYAAFLAAYPEYRETHLLDELRATDYARLDAAGHAYLDYTGASLYATSQVAEHHEMLRRRVLGNPHSQNPASQDATALVEETRDAILRYFNAPPEEYVAIFTPNATGALKLVGEAYPFASGDRYLLTFDNHNSVNGIREFARARGAGVTYAPIVLPDMRIDDGQLDAQLRAGPGARGLFAYPAQSNFSGVQHGLEWVARARRHGWDVLLDAAAFVPTNRLDLARWKPDFVALSFYKMFGYPTGVGCLLARRQALARLRRPWFAGGTITVASVQGDRHYLAEGAAAFEDGTVNFLAIPAVAIGLRYLERVGVERISRRVRCLTAWLLAQLQTLRHRSGAPVVRIYGPTTTAGRGGTITMNFYDDRGRSIDHRVVEQAAAAAKISLRTGCFCNPGGGEVALGLDRTELIACFNRPEDRLTMDDFRLCIDGKSSGAVRISLGIASNFADVYRFAAFARGFADYA